MSIIFESPVSLSEFIARGKENYFPDLECCPDCRQHVYKHGFYSRNVVFKGSAYKIYIRRYRCSNCKVTYSYLPHFLLRRFQYCFEDILTYTSEALKSKVSSTYYQLAHFYKNRFQSCLESCFMFFRDLNPHLQMPEDEKEKAIKLLEMVQAGSQTFLRRFTNHFSQNFMAR